MGNTSLIRTLALVALITSSFGLCLAGRPFAAELHGMGGARAPVIKVVASEAASQFVPLGVGKSVVIARAST